MNIGMLWFDNDPKSGLEIKIERAATYYRNKYGKAPTLCFVHPSMITGAKEGEAAPKPPEEKPQEKRLKAAGVEVRSNRSVLPNHFWIGVNGREAVSGSGLD